MAEKTTEEVIQAAILTGITEGITSKFSTSYGPAANLIDNILKEHQGKLSSILNESMLTIFNSPEFQAEIRQAINADLAKALIRGFGGQLEKAVNALKSNPETRVRITDAIEAIAAQGAK